ncbi:3-hydroxylacyl-ACP dehydratase [Accumulibacter sp.]|uniref:3-hydroxylacyl-ACP dehydratase n=1 Tax=Accumulibacter sp. TaxID=2053492 RepID=UPI0028C40B8B|nr:3-hydroxylacyl-ACP dehydratase [Accumulibacter sp.]
MSAPNASRDRHWIAGHIPHDGAMSLLERVAAWDTQRIHCQALSHRAADNPLRAGGRLGSACGIEYAAQAMAVHGALLAVAGATPRRGYIASVRGVELLAERLDEAGDTLDIVAERLSGDDNLLLYAFDVSADGRCLVRGRAAVVLDAERLATASRQP